MWPETGRARRAGVSSFGISGTNAHVIVEQAPVEEAPEVEAPEVEVSGVGVVPLVLSGKTSEALHAQATALLSHLNEFPDLALPDVGRSLVSTRARLDHRAVVLGTGRDEVIARLSALATAQVSSDVLVGRARSGRMAVLFSGQGSQRVGMARELYTAFPVFASAFDAVCAVADPLLGRSLRELVFEGDEQVLEQTEFAQPALFAVEAALFALVESQGVAPDYVLGHSVGEITAAYVAGVLSLPDAARLVVARGRLMQALPSGGAMVAVRASEAEVRPVLSGDVDIAAINGPESVVVSGSDAAIEPVVAHFRRLGRKTSRLRVSHAFHSPLMEPMLEEFAAICAQFEFALPRIGVVSNVTGDLISAEICAPEYWVRHARDAVRFGEGVEALVRQGVTRFLELGPDAVLASLVRECGVGTDAVVAAAMRGGRDETRVLLEGLGQLWVAGVDVSWGAAMGGGELVDLPTYPFERERYWLESGVPSDSVPGVDGEFWDLVDNTDIDDVGRTLGVDPDASLHEVMPALAQWNRRRSTETTLDSWLYEEHWRPVPTPTRRPIGTWLLATDDESFADRVRTELGRSAQVLRLDLDGDRTRLADSLRALPPVQGVLAMFVRDSVPDPSHDVVPLALSRMIVLIQALGDAAIDAPLWTVTRGAVSVSPTDPPPVPAQTQLWAVGRVAALEHPDRWGGLIDLPAVADDDAHAVRRLTALLSGAGVEDQVAIRASGVLARRLAHADRPASGPAQLSGTVLITGGTGGIGANLARWACANGAAHVVLVSRRGDAAPGAMELLAELRAYDAEVTVAACDITDRGAVARLLDGLRQPLTTVLHAAGVARFVLLDQLTLPGLAEEISAKVRGAELLDELTRGYPIEAFVLFSSGAAAWGSGQQGAYAAGNAHLDALARRRRAEGLPATAVAWGSWAGGGMAATAEADALLTRNGLRAMGPELAIEAMWRAVRSGAPHQVVADIDWTRFAPPFTSARPSPLIDDLPEVRTLADQESGPTATSLFGAAADDDLLDRLVVDEVAATLGCAAAKVDVERAFKELGFDSLAAVEFRDRLSMATGRTLPSTLTFDYPTPAAVVGYLRDAVVGTAVEAADRAAAPDADDVAIVAMACRYPGGVTSPEQLWALVADGAEAVGDFPADRGWDLTGIPPTGGGFLYEAADFDAAFFGISPREALAMDPQQRLLLESS
ncbi:SDR family NAD(P)-dependent oxidoreductase, partial [Nocardia sp. NPDC060259]|uniref:SDR family NAD(P)-dependent oxidoreductase n=1 Tax=Nocardia sp. NPDC060259 TaxID=3347088 RepID=UPI0036648351